MDKCQGWIWSALSLLVLLKDQAIGIPPYYIIEGPQNVTVLVGSTARFNCTVSLGWLILIWLFDGNPVVSVLSNGTTIRTFAKYDQQGYKDGSTFTSELMIFDAQPEDSGQIKCSLQNKDDNQYAFLSVEEEAGNNEDWRTQTIILAVVLSIVGLLLLILIILLIVCCCCKRKNERQHQKETRSVSENKTTNRKVDAWTLTGKENHGYLPEGKAGTEQMAVIPQFLNNSNFYAPRQHSEVNSTSEVAYNGYFGRTLPSSTAPPVNVKKIRNVTHV